MSSTREPQPASPGANSVVCNNCRFRKASCDGRRLACSRCTERSLSCSYDETGPSTSDRSSLRKQIAEHRNFRRRLRTMSGNEASEAIRRMRATASDSMATDAISSILVRQYIGNRPSELRAIHGILPPTQSGIEFELNARHPFAYPPLDPLDPRSIPIEGWFYLQDETTARNQPSQLDPSSTMEQGTHCVLVGESQTPSSPRKGPRTDLSVAAVSSSPNYQLCDSRLAIIDMKHWTETSIDNDLASRILSHFLTAHLPLFACLDVDLFLDGMVQRNSEYCSAFLVASIMAIACQSYCAFDIRSAAFSVAFEQESQLLWHNERNNDSSTNLSGMVYLAMASGMIGHESAMVQLLGDIRAMAARMHLFGVRVSDESLKSLHQQPPDRFRSMAAAAWGAYGWLTFYSTHYAADPIPYPPPLPIPGDSNRCSGGLVWPTHTVPEFLGQNITNLYKIWPMIQDFGYVYSFTNPVPLSERVTLAFAESTYQKFLVWADALDLKMSRNEQSVSHVYFFHALYHATIVRLFQPFLHNSAHVRLKSFNSRDSTPASIYMASIRQLKRLLIWYLTRAGRHSDNGWFTVAVLQIMSATLWNTNDPDWRVYFQLCFNFWKEAYMRYRIYLKIVKANLYFAYQLGVIQRSTAVAMVDELRAVGMHHDEPESAINTAIADHQMAAKRFEDSKVEAMAREFSDLAVARPSRDVKLDEAHVSSSLETKSAPSHNWLQTVLN